MASNYSALPFPTATDLSTDNLIQRQISKFLPPPFFYLYAITRALFHQHTDLNLMKELVKFHNGIIALYGAETWVLRKAEKYREIFQTKKYDTQWRRKGISYRQ
jgi:hypothetical protein